jgi:hypothetical protein
MMSSANGRSWGLLNLPSSNCRFAGTETSFQFS